MKHIFIEGSSGTGKSIAIQRIMPLINRPVYGFCTVKGLPEADGFCRVYIHDVNEMRRTCSERNCVAVCGTDGGKARAQAFDTTGAAMLSGIPDGALVVMDELGVFESEAQVFKKAVLELLDRNVMVIGAVKAVETEFLSAVKRHPEVRVYSITAENRDSLYSHIEYDINNLIDVRTRISEADFLSREWDKA